MNKATKFLTTIAVAGMVAASGSAFTAASTGVDDAIVGFDDNATSGVTVSNVAYNVESSDASLLDSIVFTEAEDVSTGHNIILTINGTTTTQIDCTATYAASVGTITCDTTGTAVVDVDSIALTVTAS